MRDKLSELAVFSGGLGGVLGSKILGWRTLGYVEKDEYCQKITRQRIKDGIIDNAPIFADVREFISEGFADLYRGRVDVVSAGFPCQPFSVAGKREGENDARNMWPETIECIRRILPQFAFLENVPGLLSTDYFWEILSDLCSIGYDAEWDIVSAAEVGANHRRQRLFILAYTKSGGWRSRRSEQPGQCGMEKENVANSIHTRLEIGRTESSGQSKKWQDENLRSAFKEFCPECGNDIWWDADFCKCRCGWYSEEWPESVWSWWSTEPDVGRVAHGVADRVDRFRAIGNGQVPLAMAYAFQKLFERINGGI